MRLNNLFESKSDATLPDMLEVFLPFVKEKLELDGFPTIRLEKEIIDDRQPTFGKFVNEEHTIYLAINNRHPLDIIRTLAHELVHFRQDSRDELDDMSGETGSPAENQANELAGVVMRDFNKANPKFMFAKPVQLPNE